MQWRLVNCCVTIKYVNRLYIFFRWRYSTLWALACRTIPLHFSLSITNSLHLLTTSTWRSLSTSSHHPFLGLPLRLVPSSSWAKIFLGILFSSIFSKWPSQLVLCPFIHFTIFSPLLMSSSSRFVLLFHSPFSYLGPYILLNIFLSKISKASSFFIVRVSAPYATIGLISILMCGKYWPQLWESGPLLHPRSTVHVGAIYGSWKSRYTAVPSDLCVFSSTAPCCRAPVIVSVPEHELILWLAHRPFISP